MRQWWATFLFSCESTKMTESLEILSFRTKGMILDQGRIEGKEGRILPSQPRWAWSRIWIAMIGKSECFVMEADNSSLHRNLSISTPFPFCYFSTDARIAAMEAKLSSLKRRTESNANTTTTTTTSLPSHSPASLSPRHTLLPTKPRQ